MDWASPTTWLGWGSARWPGTSAAGTTDAPCCAPIWATPSSTPSASRITRCTAPTCWARSSRIQALSTENKTRFHLPDGERQRQRDAAMAGGGTDFAIKAVEWIYAHDAAAATA